MDSKQPPPPYHAMPQPQPQGGYVPAQTYQPYPSGPTQPPLYPPMPHPPQQPHTVIIQTTTTANLTPIGSGPSRIRCPTCQAEVVTTVRSTPSGRTHLWALILCLFGCWPCVCVPYCMDSCQNADHTCPSCNSYIGTYQN